MPHRWVMGISSGSSFQGVHLALVEAQGAGLEAKLRPLHLLDRPFPADLREMLWRFQSSQPPGPSQLAYLHRVMGEWYAASVHQLADRAKIPLHEVLCVGFPGQAISHRPEGRYPSTLCIGMPEVVAEKTGLTTISQFRSRDVVMGGTGVPLTSLVDRMLFHVPHEDRLLAHLGGWASVLYLPAKEPLRRMIGFQAAPCGLLLDGVMRQLTGGKEAFDAWGKHGVQGCCIDPLLTRWLENPTLQSKPPRALSLDDWGDAFTTQAISKARGMERSLHDVLCTATHFIARAVAHAVKNMNLTSGRVILSGGGLKNGFLLRLLEQDLTGFTLEKLDQHGCPSESRHAVGYAGLALLTLDGIPANIPAVTGSAGPRLLGSITPGSPANWSRCLQWMARQMAPFQLAA